MAQRSEDGVGKTRETSKRLERAKAVWTRSAISIQASSRDQGCINRPDTRKHLSPRRQTPCKTSCIRWGVHTRTFTARSVAMSATDPLADISISGHDRRVGLQNRYAELLSEDALLRLAIYSRSDQCFQIVEERVLSYEAGDPEKPAFVPFPIGGTWQPWCMIDASIRHGVFGSLEDALADARLQLANSR